MIDAPTRHLPNTTTAPPGQWRYLMPETGQTFGPEPSLDSLMQALHASYKANGYMEPDDLAARVEAYICNRQPDYCTGSEPSFGRIMGALGQAAHTFHSALACLRGVTQHVLKRGYVPSEVAEARAVTCNTCPRKVEVSGCTGCNSGALVAAIERIIGAKRTSLHSHLRYCGVCDCAQSAVVWLDRDAKWGVLSEAERKEITTTAPACWLLKEAASP